MVFVPMPTGPPTVVAVARSIRLTEPAGPVVTQTELLAERKALWPAAQRHAAGLRHVCAVARVEPGDGAVVDVGNPDDPTLGRHPVRVLAHGNRVADLFVGLDVDPSHDVLTLVGDPEPVPVDSQPVGSAPDVDGCGHPRRAPIPFAPVALIAAPEDAGYREPGEDENGSGSDGAKEPAAARWSLVFRGRRWSRGFAPFRWLGYGGVRRRRRSRLDGLDRGRDRRALGGRLGPGRGRHRDGPQHVLERAHQPPDVIAPAQIAQFERVTAGERPQFRRQVLGMRHASAADEQRNHADVATAQGGLDLEPNEVLRVGDAGPVPAVRERRPCRPDNHEEDMARADDLADPIDEVDARLQLDVHEHVAFTEAGRHRVVQPPGVRCGFFAPVTDEQLRGAADHRGSPSCRAPAARRSSTGPVTTAFALGI